MSDHTPAIKSTIARKVVLLGDQNVGKTCIVLRYVEGTFGSDVTSTIGAFFLTKKISVNNENIKLQIWDTAGQERFRAMAPMYYRGAHAAILVFDMTDLNSFITMKGWVSELIDNLSPTDDIVLTIACNKADKKKDRQVPTNMIVDFAKSVGAMVFETSAKSGLGIDNLFKKTTEAMIKAKEKKEKSLLQNGAVHSPLLAENLKARNIRMRKMMSTTSLNDFDGNDGSNGCC
jgi:Ras-related protein Rab-21